jgi:hypothetical protein
MRAPHTSWVHTLRPSLSVPSGLKSLGLAHAGLPIAFTALSPALSASSGAASAISTNRISTISPTIPGRLRRYWPHAPASARRRRSHVIRRGEGTATLLMRHAPAGRARRTAGRPGS